MASPHCVRRRSSMNISTVYGRSRGLFLCITHAHILSDAKLPDIQANINVTVAPSPWSLRGAARPGGAWRPRDSV